MLAKRSEEDGASPITATLLEGRDRAVTTAPTATGLPD